MEGGAEVQVMLLNPVLRCLLPYVLCTRRSHSEGGNPVKLVEKVAIR